MDGLIIGIFFDDCCRVFLGILDHVVSHIFGDLACDLSLFDQGDKSGDMARGDIKRKKGLSFFFQTARKFYGNPVAKRTRIGTGFQRIFEVIGEPLFVYEL